MANDCYTLRETAHANIWRLDISATPTATALTRGTSRLSRPSVSPDGQWIVASLEDGVTSRIVKLPAAGGGVVDLAAGGAAVWSPDGKRLAFVTGPFTAQRIWVSDAEGRAPQEVKGAETQSNLVTWIPDGRLAWQTRDARNYRIRDLASGQEELLVKNPQVGLSSNPTFSARRPGCAVLGQERRAERTEGLWVLSWPSREERFLVPKLSADRVVGKWRMDLCVGRVDERDRQSLGPNGTDRTRGQAPAGSAC